MFVTRNVFMKYRAPAGEHGSDGGSGGSSGDGGNEGGEGGEGEKGSAGAGEGEKGDEGKGDGGKKGPTDEEARLLKEVMDKKAALKKRDEKISALEAKIKEFDGIDLEGVKAMLKEKQEQQTKKLEEQGQWDSLKKQMVEEFGKEKADLIAGLSARDAEVSGLKSTIAELTVGNAFASSTFIKDDMVMPVAKTRALYGSHFEFKDGAVVGYDKPVGAAERTVLVDAKGDPLPFEQAIRKIVEADPDRDQLLKSKMRQGSGSTTSKKSGTPDSKIDQEMSGKDRITAALSKGALAPKK